MLKRSVRGALIFGALSAGLTVPAASQDGYATLQGVVVDSVTGEPLYFVRLFLEGTDRELQTDQTGQFRISALGLGRHELTLVLNGYVSRTVGFNIAPEHLNTIDLGVMGLVPIPSYVIGVRGRVIDVNTGEPVEKATVAINGQISTDTEKDGTFAISGYEVLEGTQPVFVRRIGYESMTYPIRVDESRVAFDLDLRLQPVTVRLTDIVVEGRPVPEKLRGFFERRSMADGAFLTPWELDEIPVRHVTGFLATMRGVLVRPGQYPSRNTVRMARCGRYPPRLFVDGIEIQGGSFNTVSYTDVNGIEVYTSDSRVPIQFQRNSGNQTCGTIVIWTGER